MSDVITTQDGYDIELPAKVWISCWTGEIKAFIAKRSAELWQGVEVAGLSHPQHWSNLYHTREAAIRYGIHYWEELAAEYHDKADKLREQLRNIEQSQPQQSGVDRK